MMSTPHLKIKFYARKRIRKILKNMPRSPTPKTNELFGCTPQFLKSYLEQRFAPGMTWDNHGKVWHIDHVRPCASFDLSKRRDLLACFHYTNMQPLFAEENMRKSDSVPTQLELYAT